MKKACCKCGRVHDYSYKCNAWRSPREYKGTEEDKLRSRYSWKKKRVEIKERAFYLCEVCKDKGDYRPKAVEVHHIRKLKDDSDGLLENDNLITLCIDHHRKADRGEISLEYLLELVKKRDAEE